MSAVKKTKGGMVMRRGNNKISIAGKFNKVGMVANPEVLPKDLRRLVLDLGFEFIEKFNQELCPDLHLDNIAFSGFWIKESGQIKTEILINVFESVGEKGDKKYYNCRIVWENTEMKIYLKDYDRGRFQTFSLLSLFLTLNKLSHGEPSIEIKTEMVVARFLDLLKLALISLWKEEKEEILAVIKSEKDKLRDLDNKKARLVC